MMSQDIKRLIRVSENTKDLPKSVQDLYGDHYKISLELVKTQIKRYTILTDRKVYNHEDANFFPNWYIDF